MKTDVEIVEERAPAAVPVDAAALITMALEKGASIDTLERLMALREKLRQEAEEREFYEALSAFQAECPVIIKDHEAKGKKGFIYKYTPMETIKPIAQPLLTKHGFSYRMEFEFDEVSVTAECILSHRGGHSVSTKVRIPIDKEAYMNDSQKVGAACTYAGRYAFVGGTGVVCGGEDTDAQNGANGRVAAEPLLKPITPSPPPLDRDEALATIVTAIGKRGQEFGRKATCFLMGLDWISASGDFKELKDEHLRQILARLPAFLDKVAATPDEELL